MLSVSSLDRWFNVLVIFIAFIASSPASAPLFITAKFWEKSGEIVEQYVKKGKNLFISGELRRNEYNGKTFLELNADRMEFLPGGTSQKRSETQTTQTTKSTAEPVDEDDIPF